MVSAVLVRKSKMNIIFISAKNGLVMVVKGSTYMLLPLTTGRLIGRHYCRTKFMSYRYVSGVKRLLG